MITAAADGSALGNPGPAGWAWYVDDDRWAAGGWDSSTNNRGELQAVIELLDATSGSGEDLLVLCDSKYVINSVTKWIPVWKLKGWKKSNGKDVLNRDQMELLDAALESAKADGRRIRFEWVKGHSDHPLNEAADSRARGAAEAHRSGSPVPTGPGFPGEAGSAGGADSPEQTAARPAEAGSGEAADSPERASADAQADAVTVSCRLTSAESEAIIAAARAAGRRPQEELASLIRFALAERGLTS